LWGIFLLFPVCQESDRDVNKQNETDTSPRALKKNETADRDIDSSSQPSPLKNETETSALKSSENETLIFEDDFDTFNLSTWKHELTLG
jgi:hypothetical protein